MQGVHIRTCRLRAIPVKRGEAERPAAAVFCCDSHVVSTEDGSTEIMCGTFAEGIRGVASVRCLWPLHNTRHKPAVMTQRARLLYLTSRLCGLDRPLDLGV